MNNEEKILEMLGQLIKRQDKTDVSIAQMREEMNERFDKLEADMKFAWQDIKIVENRIKQHEKEYHEAV